eukprot:TRINITY_DN193_c0_g2_i1.p1 TRINITY_DN193_c0_g2~~TRINITY_DN193_c0_g2_i1.p1  ORF type:complete len:191 (-),score=32.56 TRINITY_DN193_c0_g2_i1:161-733(-)
MSLSYLQDVIGWFKFRRNTPLQPTVREIVANQNLRRLLKERTRSNLDYMTDPIFAVFTQTQPATDMSIHSFLHRFFAISNNQYSTLHPIELSIRNLTNSSQDQYQSFDSFPMGNSNSVVDKTLAGLGLAMKTPSNLQYTVPPHVNELETFITQSILGELEKLIGSIEESEQQISSLERSIQLKRGQFDGK